MEASSAKVLAKLRKKRVGITVSDFPVGFRLAARVHDLRQAGYVIETVKQATTDIARYVLLGEPHVSH